VVWLSPAHERPRRHLGCGEVSAVGLCVVVPAHERPRRHLGCGEV
jgi:hypothetical protein